MFSYIARIKKTFTERNIGSRIALYILSACILLAVLAVSIMSFYQHNAERNKLINITNALVVSAERSLIKGLLDSRFEGVNTIKDGMGRLPFVKAFLIENMQGQRYQYGDIDSRYYVLKKDIIDNGAKLGFINIYIDNEPIYNSVLSHLKIMVVVSVLFFGLLGILFYFLIDFSIVRHIKKITTLAAVSNRLNAKSYIPIRIHRKRIPDEITTLVDMLNDGQRKYKEIAVEKSSYESWLSFQINYDPLTNLPNRKHLNTYLDERLVHLQAVSEPTSLAILFIDLDGFKNINDAQGHDIGDYILKETAVRFGQLLFPYDSYISRFGGDEFVAVIENHGRESVEGIAIQLIESLADPFVFEDKKINVGCSVGVSFAPDDGWDAKELIEKSELVMCKAKEEGQKSCVFFDPKMMDQVVFANKVKQKLMVSDLDDLLEVYFQPLVNLSSMNVIGFEVLLRWFDDELGFVPPDVFIPIAEKNGLVFRVDSWVFSKGIKQVDLWREKYNEDFIVAVNFSPTNFQDSQFSEWLDTDSIFSNYLDWVELEVTERFMLADDVVAISGIERLLEVGIKFSIDDFGTGYSSLGYIKKFRHILSKIKIDRMFINELLNDDADQALVKSIVTMAESLSIEVLAEGIETQEQEKVLMELGCEFGQGYFYSKPIPAKEIDELLLLWNKGAKAADDFEKNTSDYRSH